MRMILSIVTVLLTVGFVSLVSVQPAQANDIKDWLGDDVGEKVVDVVIDEVQRERGHKRRKDDRNNRTDNANRRDDNRTDNNIRERHARTDDQIRYNDARTVNQNDRENNRADNYILRDDAVTNNDIKRENNRASNDSDRSSQEHQQGIERAHVQENVDQPGESEPSAAVGQKWKARYLKHARQDQATPAGNASTPSGTQTPKPTGAVHSTPAPAKTYASEANVIRRRRIENVRADDSPEPSSQQDRIVPSHWDD
ncbi:MAG: hypothetical protein WD049_10265 [Candidatus Paceibacterota bacterium]